MKYLHHIFLFIFLIIICSLSAQDKVRFSDGKELKCKVQGVTDTTVWVYQKGERKTKEAIISNKDVFSVVYGDSNEVVIYKPDPSDAKAFTVLQMKSYVEGASFARRNYSSCLATSTAFVVGAGGGILGFWGFLPVLVYDLVVSSYQIHPKSRKKEPVPAVVDDFFMYGFRDVAQKKKAIHVIASSLAGIATGAIYTYILLSPK